jgi:Na+-driven multidrug efflux pump
MFGYGNGRCGLGFHYFLFIMFWIRLWFFLSRNSELKINFKDFGIDRGISREIASLGFVTLARQAVVSIVYLLMNNILFDLGGEDSVTVYAIIARMLMFALFPVLGMTQGFYLLQVIIMAPNYGIGLKKVL